MKTALALVLAATFATSSVNAQTIAAPTDTVPGVLSDSGLSGASAAIGIAAAIVVIGTAVAIGASDKNDNNSTNGTTAVAR